MALHVCEYIVLFTKLPGVTTFIKHSSAAKIGTDLRYVTIDTIAPQFKSQNKSSIEKNAVLGLNVGSFYPLFKFEHLMM